MKLLQNKKKSNYKQNKHLIRTEYLAWLLNEINISLIWYSSLIKINIWNVKQIFYHVVIKLKMFLFICILYLKMWSAQNVRMH